MMIELFHDTMPNEVIGLVNQELEAFGIQFVDHTKADGDSISYAPEWIERKSVAQEHMICPKCKSTEPHKITLTDVKKTCILKTTGKLGVSLCINTGSIRRGDIITCGNLKCQTEWKVE